MCGGSGEREAAKLEIGANREACKKEATFD